MHDSISKQTRESQGQQHNSFNHRQFLALQVGEWEKYCLYNKFSRYDKKIEAHRYQ